MYLHGVHDLFLETRKTILYFKLYANILVDNYYCWVQEYLCVIVIGWKKPALSWHTKYVLEYTYTHHRPY